MHGTRGYRFCQKKMLIFVLKFMFLSLILYRVLSIFMLKYIYSIIYLRIQIEIRYWKVSDYYWYFIYLYRLITIFTLYIVNQFLEHHIELCKTTIQQHNYKSLVIISYFNIVCACENLWLHIVSVCLWLSNNCETNDVLNEYWTAQLLFF